MGTTQPILSLVEDGDPEGVAHGPRSREGPTVKPPRQTTRRRFWWPPALPQPPQLPPGRWLPALLGVVLGFAAGVLVQAGDVCLGGNFHAVVPGKVYRSAQLSSEALGECIHDHGIRTVINLRGENADEDWYRREVEVTAKSGAAFRDVGLW